MRATGRLDPQLLCRRIALLQAQQPRPKPDALSLEVSGWQSILSRALSPEHAGAPRMLCGIGLCVQCSTETCVHCPCMGRPHHLRAAVRGQATTQALRQVIA
jgi:hypothetical protein